MIQSSINQMIGAGIAAAKIGQRQQPQETPQPSIRSNPLDFQKNFELQRKFQESNESADVRAKSITAQKKAVLARMDQVLNKANERSVAKAKSKKAIVAGIRELVGGK